MLGLCVSYFVQETPGVYPPELLGTNQRPPHVRGERGNELGAWKPNAELVFPLSPLILPGHQLQPRLSVEPFPVLSPVGSSGFSNRKLRCPSDLHVRSEPLSLLNERQISDVASRMCFHGYFSTVRA